MHENGPRRPSGRTGASLVERAAERIRKTRSSDSDLGPAAHTSPAADMEVSKPASEDEQVHARASMSDRRGQSVSEKVDVDTEMLASHGYLTPKSMRSQLAEEMRLIKRGVVQTFWYQEVERANLIMVSSAYPGEGKSFVAMNLAISLACEVDFHVLLVDADFERPVVFDRLGLGNHPGLMDLLKNPELDMSDIMLRTNMERLSLIGPGRRDDMSTELLASKRMQQLMQEMADRYPDRLIIFDTPPLLSCSEPAVLAEHMGQAIFVIEADATQKEVVEQAIELVPASCKLGLVLNKSRAAMGADYYSYYGYRGRRGA